MDINSSFKAGPEHWDQAVKDTEALLIAKLPSKASNEVSLSSFKAGPEHWKQAVEDTKALLIAKLPSNASNEIGDMTYNSMMELKVDFDFKNSELLKYKINHPEDQKILTEIAKIANRNHLS